MSGDSLKSNTCQQPEKAKKGRNLFVVLLMGLQEQICIVQPILLHQLDKKLDFISGILCLISITNF